MTDLTLPRVRLHAMVQIPTATAPVRSERDRDSGRGEGAGEKERNVPAGAEGRDNHHPRGPNQPFGNQMTGVLR